MVLLLFSPGGDVLAQKNTPMTLPWRSQWSPAEAELLHALAHIQRDLPLRSLLDLEEIVRKYPGTPVSAMAQFEMGILLFGNGWLEEAQSAFGKLTAAAPAPDPVIRVHQMRAQLMLGVLQQRRGRGDAARLAWRKVLTDYEDRGLNMSDGSTPAEMADFQIGCSYLAEGKTQQGVAYLRDFIRRRPDCYLAHRAVTLLSRQGARIGAAPPPANQRRIVYGHPAAKPETRNPKLAMAWCGPLCLTRALQRWGIRAEASAVARQAGTQANGTTLWQLKRVAEKQGLVAEGFYFADRDVGKLQLPAIVWVKRNHYVLVEAVEKKWLGISYFDPVAQDWRRSRRAVRVYDPAAQNPSRDSNGAIPNRDSNGAIPNRDSNGAIPSRDSNGAIPNRDGHGAHLRTLALEELTAPWGYGWDGYALQLRRKDATKTLAAGGWLRLAGVGWGWLWLVGVGIGGCLWRLRPSSLIPHPSSLILLLTAFRFLPPRYAHRPRRRVALGALVCFLSSLYLAPAAHALRPAPSARRLAPCAPAQTNTRGSARSCKSPSCFSGARQQLRK